MLQVIGEVHVHAYPIKTSILMITSIKTTSYFRQWSGLTFKPIPQYTVVKMEAFTTLIDKGDTILKLNLKRTKGLIQIEDRGLH